MSHTIAHPTIRIRPAEPGEYSAIGELTHAAYAHDYPDLAPDYREQLKHPETLLDAFDFHVATDPITDELVGSIALLRPGHDQDGRIAPDELYFRLLATHPAARGRGIGGALTEFALTHARDAGRSAVVLHSGPEMVGAHALYRKLGFSHRPERSETVALPDGRSFQLLTFVRDL